jgi:hypothetical protein
MPRPVYVLCAKGITEDKLSSLMTAFSILESMEFGTERREASILFDPLTVQLQGLSVWMREESDDEVEFEHQWAVHGGGRHDTLPATTFRFERERPLFRFTLLTKGIPILTESGLIEFESRVRRLGADEWLSQSFPIVCRVNLPQPAATT